MHSKKVNEFALIGDGHESILLRALSSRYPNSDERALYEILVIMRMANAILTAIENHFADLGISQGRFAVLLILGLEPDFISSPSKLAEQCGVTRTAITGLVDGLEKSGFVRRRGNEADRRSLLIELTEEGKTFLDETIPKDYAFLSQMRQNLSNSELEELMKLAVKVTGLFGRK